MNPFLDRLISSLDTTTIGFSARKLSSMVSLGVAIIIAIFLLPEKDRIYAFYGLLAYSLICMGLVTVPQLIEVLNARKQKSNDEK